MISRIASSDGEDVSKAISCKSRTRWANKETQRFELEFSVPLGTYIYTLWIRNDSSQDKIRIEKEKLQVGELTIFEISGGSAHFYSDTNGNPHVSSLISDKYSIFTNPRSLDILRDQFLAESYFRDIICARITPAIILAESRDSVSKASINMSDFASWYSHLLQEKPEIISELLASLKAVLPGFQSLAMPGIEDFRQLKVKMQMLAEQGKTVSDFLFTELSDGQKMLVVLYTLLHNLNDQSILCIDEPDNYISLQEIEPWLHALEDKVDDTGAQCLIISHHPELIDRLAVDCGIYFYRENNGPVRTKRFENTLKDNLSASELVARGWENE